MEETASAGEELEEDIMAGIVNVGKERRKQSKEMRGDLRKKKRRGRADIREDAKKEEEEEEEEEQEVEYGEV